MCYQRRVHSITGYSPFKVLFGFQMKHFGDLRIPETEDEVFVWRNSEIGTPFSACRTSCNRKNSSSSTRSTKNQHRNDDTILYTIDTIDDTTLSHRIDGTKQKVEENFKPLKAKGLLGKLKPHFRGPYKLYGQDKKLNFRFQRLKNHFWKLCILNTKSKSFILPKVTILNIQKWKRYWNIVKSLNQLFFFSNGTIIHNLKKVGFKNPNWYNWENTIEKVLESVGSSSSYEIDLY